MVEITIFWFLATLTLMIPSVESFGQNQSRPKFKGSNCHCVKQESFVSNWKYLGAI